MILIFCIYCFFKLLVKAFYFVIIRPVDFVASRTSRLAVYSGLTLGLLSTMSSSGYFGNVPFLSRMHLSTAPVSTMIRNVLKILDSCVVTGDDQMFAGVPEAAQVILGIVLFIPMLWACLLLVFLSAYLYHFELMIGITGLAILLRIKRRRVEQEDYLQASGPIYHFVVDNYDTEPFEKGMV